MMFGHFDTRTFIEFIFIWLKVSDTTTIVMNVFSLHESFMFSFCCDEAHHVPHLVHFCKKHLFGDSTYLLFSYSSVCPYTEQLFLLACCNSATTSSVIGHSCASLPRQQMALWTWAASLKWQTASVTETNYKAPACFYCLPSLHPAFTGSTSCTQPGTTSGLMLLFNRQPYVVML